MTLEDLDVRSINPQPDEALEQALEVMRAELAARLGVSKDAISDDDIADYYGFEGASELPPERATMVRDALAQHGLKHL